MSIVCCPIESQKEMKMKKWISRLVEKKKMMKNRKMKMSIMGGLLVPINKGRDGNKLICVLKLKFSVLPLGEMNRCRFFPLCFIGKTKVDILSYKREKRCFLHYPPNPLHHRQPHLHNNQPKFSDGVGEFPLSIPITLNGKCDIILYYVFVIV